MDETSGSSPSSTLHLGNDGTISRESHLGHRPARPGPRARRHRRLRHRARRPSLDITDAITIAAWVKPGKVGTQYLVKKAINDATDGYELSLSNPGKAFFRLNQGWTAAATAIASTRRRRYPTDGNTWMHVAATYDGSTMRIYVDGVEEVPVLGPVAGPASIVANSLSLAIGAESNGGSPFQGAIDDVYLYGRALTATEIAALAVWSPAIRFLWQSTTPTRSISRRRSRSRPPAYSRMTPTPTAIPDGHQGHRPGPRHASCPRRFVLLHAIAAWVGTDIFTYKANDSTDDSTSPPSRSPPPSTSAASG